MPGGVWSSRRACSCPVGFHTGERPPSVHLQVLVLWGSRVCSAVPGAVLTLPPCPHRFIQQVNLAAVTIQRWYRRHSQRHRAAAAALGRLMAAKREVGPVPCSVAQTTRHPCPTGHTVGVPLVPRAGLRKSRELWLCMVQRAGEVPVPSELCWLCPGISLGWVPAGAEAQRLSTTELQFPQPPDWEQSGTSSSSTSLPELPPLVAREGMPHLSSS